MYWLYLQWDMIYTCQDSGKNRLQRRPEILLREFLLHGSLDTIIPVLKQGGGGSSSPLLFKLQLDVGNNIQLSISACRAWAVPSSCGSSVTPYQQKELAASLSAQPMDPTDVSQGLRDNACVWSSCRRAQIVLCGVCLSTTLYSQGNNPQWLSRHSFRARANSPWPHCLLPTWRLCWCLKPILQLLLCRSLQSRPELHRELSSQHRCLYSHL